MMCSASPLPELADVGVVPINGQHDLCRCRHNICHRVHEPVQAKILPAILVGRGPYVIGKVQVVEESLPELALFQKITLAGEHLGVYEVEFGGSGVDLGEDFVVAP